MKLQKAEEGQRRNVWFDGYGPQTNRALDILEEAGVFDHGAEALVELALAVLDQARVPQATQDEVARAVEPFIPERVVLDNPDQPAF